MASKAKSFGRAGGGAGKRPSRSGPSIESRTPQASSPLVRRVMQANTGRTTQPEAALRSVLHRHGLRYRVNVRPHASVRCKADILFRRARVCVFVDGCFWHGCPKHFTVPKQNREWWLEKIAANRLRDARYSRALRRLGWHVLRFWAHDLEADRLTASATKILKAVRPDANANADGFPSQTRGEDPPEKTSSGHTLNRPIGGEKLGRRARRTTPALLHVRDQ